MKALKIVDLTYEWGSKDMVVAGYAKGQRVWVPRKFGRDRNEWGVLDRDDYRVEITEWLYGDGALTPDVTIFSHAGTHVEAPGYHMINPPEHLKTKGVADFPPDKFFGEAAVLDLTPFAEKAGAKGPPPDYSYYMASQYHAAKEPGKGTAPRTQMKFIQLTAEDLKVFDKRVRKGDILLPYNKISGSMVLIDVNWIVDKGIKMVGMELFATGANVFFHGARDGITNPHDVLLSNEIPIIEGLRNLHKLTKERVFYIGMPWKLLGVGASPVWAIAIEEFDYTPM